MRKVFLDELSRWEEGKYKGKINWKASIGEKIKFIYEDIEGEVEIIRYESKGQYLYLNYGDERGYRIKTSNFTNCKLGKLLGEFTDEFKYKVGQVVKDEKRGLIITDREYRHRLSKNDECIINEKWYKYTCDKCGWNEGWIVESGLKSGTGCSCCAGRTAVLGINTIWDTDRWMCDLGVSEEDAKKYTRCSDEKIEVDCPDCGEHKIITTSRISRHKSICCSCGDGTSYPEKVMVSVLAQLGIEFKHHVGATTFDWCKNILHESSKLSGDKEYDFYVPSFNMIVETHGGQHYEESRRKGARTLAEEQENDRVKKKLALANGIDRYIVIDCRYSNAEWIKNSVLNSELSTIFDLSKMDWLKCEEFALKNVVKQVCEYWNNKEEWETTTTIAENNPWGIKAKTTIIDYLKRGTELGWTNYDPKEEREKCIIICNKLKCKKIEIFKDDVSLGVFESCAELERQSKERFGTKLLNSKISLVCNDKKPQYKGFTFRYVEEDNNQIVS